MGGLRNMVASAAVVAVTLGAAAGIVSAQSAVVPGGVVSLRGTPHIWVADNDGVLHWAGDTRALAGRDVKWSTQREVDLGELTQMRRGSPWLSSGLLKIADPIYLVKWESNQAAPTLLHIQSIKDVELFGINGDNYGEFVVDPAKWDAKFGISSTMLPRGVMASATGPAPATATPTATPLPALGTYSDTLRLNRNPRLQADGELFFSVPTDWTEGYDFADARQANIEPMASTNRLGGWRATPSDKPSPIYVYIGATNLDWHKDARTPEDFARKAAAHYCRVSTGGQCTQVSSSTVVAFAGQSALRFETRSVIEYTGTDGNGQPVGRRHEWSAYHYFFIRGNWAYEFRVFGETPETFATRAQPVVDVLAGTRFF